MTPLLAAGVTDAEALAARCAGIEDTAPRGRSIGAFVATGLSAAMEARNPEPEGANADA